jgi:hypothetical protein
VKGIRLFSKTQVTYENAKLHRQTDRGFDPSSLPHLLHDDLDMKKPPNQAVFRTYFRGGSDGRGYRTCYFFVPLNLDNPQIMHQLVRMQLSGQETTQALFPAA